MAKLCSTLLMLSVFCVSSCSVLTDLPSKKDGTHSVIVSSDRLSLTQLQEKSLELKVGMGIEEVREFLGIPDYTEVETHGQRSPKGPWNALVWTYERKTGKYSTKKFKVVFAEEVGLRYLNSWHLL